MCGPQATPELRIWRTEGQEARAKLEHGRYILLIKYRVSQTHRGAAQYKTFSSSDARWTADGRSSSWPTAEEGLARVQRPQPTNTL